MRELRRVRITEVRIAEGANYGAEGARLFLEGMKTTLARHGKGSEGLPKMERLK